MINDKNKAAKILDHQRLKLRGRSYLIFFRYIIYLTGLLKMWTSLPSWIIESLVLALIVVPDVLVFVHGLRAW